MHVFCQFDFSHATGVVYNTVAASKHPLMTGRHLQLKG